MFSWYLYFTLPIFIHAYSALTVVSLVTAISTRRLFSRQAADLFQSKPIFANEEITEAMFVVIPGVVEINKAIQPLLYHCPSSTSCCLLAIYIKGSFVIRIDCINTADSLTAFENLGTVPGCSKNNDD